MADRVQFILDKMAPIFKDLEKLEIFSKVLILLFLNHFFSSRLSHLLCLCLSLPLSLLTLSSLNRRKSNQLSNKEQIMNIFFVVDNYLQQIISNI
jgi:hypothetical protein